MGPDGPTPGGLGSNAWRVRLRERRLVHHQTVEQNSHLAPLAAKTYRVNGLLAAERPSPQRSEERPHVFERVEFRPRRRHLPAVINSSNAKNKATALT